MPINIGTEGVGKIFIGAAMPATANITAANFTGIAPDYSTGSYTLDVDADLTSYISAGDTITIDAQLSFGSSSFVPSWSGEQEVSSIVSNSPDTSRIGLVGNSFGNAVGGVSGTVSGGEVPQTVSKVYAGTDLVWMKSAGTYVATSTTATGTFTNPTGAFNFASFTPGTLLNTDADLSSFSSGDAVRISGTGGSVDVEFGTITSSGGVFVVGVVINPLGSTSYSSAPSISGTITFTLLELE